MLICCVERDRNVFFFDKKNDKGTEIWGYRKIFVCRKIFWGRITFLAWQIFLVSFWIKAHYAFMVVRGIVFCYFVAIKNSCILRKNEKKEFLSIISL